MASSSYRGNLSSPACTGASLFSGTPSRPSENSVPSFLKIAHELCDRVRTEDGIEKLRALSQSCPQVYDVPKHARSGWSSK